MPIKEVCSPVSRPGSKVSGNTGLMPGARSNPSRGDSVPAQPSHGTRSTHGEEPASMEITGPTEE
jgi:hypothetical protein